MSSFVQTKANKQWIWIAMDAKNRQVIAFHVGDRSRRSAKRLWAKIPQAYRQRAMFYTDQYVLRLANSGCSGLTFRANSPGCGLIITANRLTLCAHSLQTGLHPLNETGS
jgi:hypothetical protein